MKLLFILKMNLSDTDSFILVSSFMALDISCNAWLKKSDDIETMWKTWSFTSYFADFIVDLL